MHTSTKDQILVYLQIQTHTFSNVSVERFRLTRNVEKVQKQQIGFLSKNKLFRAVNKTQTYLWAVDTKNIKFTMM